MRAHSVSRNFVTGPNSVKQTRYCDWVEQNMEPPDMPEAPWRPVRPQSAPLGQGAPGQTPRRPSSAASPRTRLMRKVPLDTGLSTKGYSKQSLNVKKRAPAYGFGAATRDQANKVFVSQEHTLIAMGGFDSPGPAAYVLPANIGGKQPDARKPDPPVWRFNQADRFLFGYGKPDPRPAPGAYEVQPSIGVKQPNGKLEDRPAWGFGTATRSHTRKVFVSQDHQKTDFHGVDSPGPARYTLPASVKPLAYHAVEATHDCP